MSTETKACRQCNEAKPLSEFYNRGRGRGEHDVQATCKDCSKKRHGGQTGAKINRNRARHRAIAVLVERHADEFEALYERCLAEAAAEAEALAQTTDAKQHYGDGKGGPVRLRPGKRLTGQKAGDRIDVARCPHCIRHHDRGHVCVKCGAAPVKNTGRRDDGIVDEVAIQRRMNGDKEIPLTKPERTELVRRCRKAGWSYNEIEDLAGVPKAERYVERETAS